MITHDTQIRVIYRDTDKMGVVYHANYIVFYEAARNEMFRAIGLPYTLLEQQGITQNCPKAKVQARQLPDGKWQATKILKIEK